MILMRNKCFELFEFGQRVADERGLILVDTKYEFGFLGDDIILIDELHTCDVADIGRNLHILRDLIITKSLKN